MQRSDDKAVCYSSHLVSWANIIILLVYFVMDSSEKLMDSDCLVFDQTGSLGKRVAGQPYYLTIESNNLSI